MWGGMIPVLTPLFPPEELKPRFHNGIRIRRFRLYSNSTSVSLRPDSGVSVLSDLAFCHSCGVSWSAKQAGTTCWSCDDNTVLPAKEDGESYDQKWFTADL